MACNSESWRICGVALTFVLTVLAPSALAQGLELVVEGSAQIEKGNRLLARQVALRRAMASASDQVGGTLQSTTVHHQGLVQERSSLTGKARILGVRILEEKVDKGLMTVKAQVRVEDPLSPAPCGDKPLRKLIITAFPLLYPERLAPGSFLGWPQDAPSRIARRLERGGRLLALAKPNAFVHRDAEQAPELYERNGEALALTLARNERAQAVLAAVFRDLAVHERNLLINERRIVLDAYLHDGFTGVLLGRKTFARSVGTLWRSLPARPDLDSDDFIASDFGAAYYGLLEEVAQWSEQVVGCLPFGARVLKVEGRKLWLDAGSDTGIDAGTEFMITRQLEPPIYGLDGQLLGREQAPLNSAIVQGVYPRFAIAELPGDKSRVKPGDVLYAY